MFKKAISIGVTAALLGSLMVALVPGVAFGVSWTTSPTPIPTVARGTEAGAASLAITENSPCEFSGGNRLDIWIRDKAGGNTVFFGAGGAVGPDSLAPTLTHDPNDDSHLWVRMGTANCSQIETLTLTGLKIYADGHPYDGDNAALGNIQVLYGLSDNAANWVVMGQISGGVAVWAHIGGFAAGVLFSGLFEDPELIARHREVLRSKL